MSEHNRAKPELAAAAKDGVVGGGVGGTGAAPGASVHEWLGGLDGKLVDLRVDKDSHNLHAAVGQVCPTCQHLIESGQSVRKTVSGTYKHDAC